MDEQKIRQIIQEELKKSDNLSRFRVNSIPQHVHNGTDSPQIPESNIKRNPAVFGSVLFASSGVDYIFQLNLPYEPQQVIVNGVFVDSVTGTAPIDDRYQVWGVASLGQSYYLQPVDNRTVTVGGRPYPAATNLSDGSTASIPAQSSTFFGFIAGATEATAGVNQFSIAGVFGSADLDIRVVEFNRSTIVFRVLEMTSGWSFTGNYHIT